MRGGGRRSASVVLAVAALAAVGAASSFAATPPGAIPKPPGENPDDRGWEKVSPDDKNGSDVIYHRTAVQSALDGGAVAFKAAGVGGNPANVMLDNDLVARRGPDGWSASNLSWPRSDELAGVQFEMRWGVMWFSPDLSRAAFMSGNPPLVPGAAPNVRNLYFRDTRSGQTTLLSPPPVSPLDPFAEFVDEPLLADVSGDGDRALFESAQRLTADAPDQSAASPPAPNVYEWADGTTRLVAANAVPGAGLRPAAYSFTTLTDRSMSSDGSRIVYTQAPVGGGGSNSPGGQIYVRESDGTTHHVSASQRDGALPEDSRPSQFLTATPDGRYVFFGSCERLTNDSTADPGADPDCLATGEKQAELYRYDVETGDLIDLSAGLGNDLGTGTTAGLVGVSDDGSRAYFTSSSNADLYVWHDGAVTEIVGDSDFPATGYFPNVFNSPSRTSRVSSDGRLLLLTTAAQLDPSRDTGGHLQVQYYDASSGEFSCASCPPDGGPASSAASISPFQGANGVTARHLVTATDAAGRRVFFETATALVPADVNGKVDVYQYDVVTRRHSLVSSGTGAYDAHIGDVSVDGRSVFFVTAGQLVAADRDGLRDVYVARVGGGFPEPPANRLPCDGDSCQPPASGAPSRGTPASETLRTATRNGQREGGPSVLPLTSAQRVKLARGKRVALAIRVAGPGRVVTVVRTRIGGRSAVVATRRVVARRAGRLRVEVRLPSRARRALARSKRLELTIAVRSGGDVDRRAVLIRTGHR